MAQRRAALSRVGAASFTASLMRWSFAGPPPPLQARTAVHIFTPNPTATARKFLSSSRDLKGSSGTMDFTDGRYYIESFDASSAVVSFLATGHLADHGTPQRNVLLGGTVHLQALNGQWHFADLTVGRSIQDLQRMGTPYWGGC